jgi:RNA polymerase sigma-70 factor (ECF subfamily)
MNRPNDFHVEILACLPHLRAFALLLSRNRSTAEDLVQDTVVSALSHIDQFQPGTNLKGWLTTILRNRYFNELRRMSRKLEVQVDVVGAAAGTSGGQEESLTVRDFKHAFSQLPAEQREALVLVGASGFSYEETAEIIGCAVGTVKSRVSRGRFQLHRMLNEEAPAQPALEAYRSTRDSQPSFEAWIFKAASRPVATTIAAAA